MIVVSFVLTLLFGSIQARVILITPQDDWQSAIEGRVAIGLVEPKVGPGDTLLFADGTYTPLTPVRCVWTGASANATGVITIASRNPGGAVLRAPNTNTPVVEVSSGTFFNFRNFRLEGGSVGVQLSTDQAGGGDISNANFADLLITNIATAGVSANVPARSYTSVSFSRCSVWDLNGAGNRACFQLGCPAATPCTFSLGHVEWSLCHGTGAAGTGVMIHSGSHSNNVRFNNIYDVGDGIVGVDSGAGGGQSRIYGNSVVNVSDTGISVGGNYWVHDNVVLNALTLGLEVIPSSGAQSPDNALIVFNTVVNAPTGIQIDTLPSSTGIQVRNNALFRTAAAISIDNVTLASFGPNAIPQNDTGTVVPLQEILLGAVALHVNAQGFPVANSGLIGRGEQNTVSPQSWSGRDLSCNPRPTGAATDLGASMFNTTMPMAVLNGAIRAQNPGCPGTPPFGPLPVPPTTQAPTTAAVPQTFTVDCTAPRCATNLDYTLDGQLDPILTLVRGRRYIFNLVGLSDHPFSIHSAPQDINLNLRFINGVTGNGNRLGQLIFDVPAAPAIPTNVLYYQCEAHPAMSGPINIVSTPGEVGVITQNLTNPPQSGGGPCVRDGNSLDAGVRFTLALDTLYATFECDLYLNNLATTINFPRNRIKLEDDNWIRLNGEWSTYLDVIFVSGIGNQVSAAGAFDALRALVRVGDTSIPAIGAPMRRINDRNGQLVVAYPSNPGFQYWWAVLIFAGVVVIILIIILAGYCYKRRQQRGYGYAKHPLHNEMQSYASESRSSLLYSESDSLEIAPGSKGIQGYASTPGTFRSVIKYDVQDSGESILDDAKKGMTAQVTDSDWNVPGDWVWSTVIELGKQGWLPRAYLTKN